MSILAESLTPLAEVSSVHEKTIGSKGGDLWGIPGAQLPAAIQHVYNDLVKGGKSPGSLTYRLAVGIVRNWSQGHDGKGNKVSAETQKSGVAAMAEFDALRAKAHARSGAGKAKRAAMAASEEPVAPSGADLAMLAEGAALTLDALSGSINLDALMEDVPRNIEWARPLVEHVEFELRVFEAARGSGPRERSGVWTNVLHKVTKRGGTEACPSCGTRKSVDTSCPNCKAGHVAESVLDSMLAGRGPLAEADGEKHDPAAFLGRVKSLKKGEIARMPDGHAVKHHATEDGRDVWSAGQPSRYREGGLSFDEQHRTAEAAVAAAHEMSARSTDPLSLGGPHRFGRYSTVTSGGREVRIAKVDEHGVPHVYSPRESSENARPTTFAALRPAAPRVFESVLAGSVDAPLLG